MSVRPKIIIKLHPKITVKDTSSSFQPRSPTMTEILADQSRSVWSAILQQNQYNKELLRQILNRQLTKTDFKRLASERAEGQWAWGMKSFNIRHPKFLCKHGCSYCYIGPMFKRFKRVCQQVAMEDLMPVDSRMVNKSWSLLQNPSLRQMIFFPSSSDIFEENAHDYVQVCRKILHSGHEVMFVTKPTLRSIRAIVTQMEQDDMSLFQTKMSIFITITTNQESLRQVFEPNTSTYQERLQVILFLIEHHFRVNVMMEPYLSDPIPMIRELRHILEQQEATDWVIAIGKVNYTGAIQFSRDPEQDLLIKTNLTQLYSPIHIKELWSVVENDPHLFLKKDSVVDLLRCM